MNNMANISDRVVVLCAQNLVRVQQLPADALLTLFLQQLITSRTCHLRKLQTRNSIWQQLISDIPTTRAPRQIYIDKTDLKLQINHFLLDQWHSTQSKFVYAGQCRTTLGIDPIMYLPMTVHERSRLIRWRMGWLPGKPQACRNCNQINNLTTQLHVIICFQICENLDMDIHAFLNLLPKSPPRSSADKSNWKNRWIVLQQFLFNLESICLPPDKPIDSATYTGQSPFVAWFKGSSPSSTTTPTLTHT
ncbi:hypothetical protein [Parasitella parasitica]|uniref:Uncharacterized protein n=1 Tax=Parasitella parasitica TaxID=35722 RepID=A0A0B7NHM6_9FUNG|nr:hypothetical protein [Parasitella parasitica]